MPHRPSQVTLVLTTSPCLGHVGMRSPVSHLGQQPAGADLPPPPTAEADLPPPLPSAGSDLPPSRPAGADLPLINRVDTHNPPHLDEGGLHGLRIAHHDRQGGHAVWRIEACTYWGALRGGPRLGPRGLHINEPAGGTGEGTQDNGDTEMQGHGEART